MIDLKEYLAKPDKTIREHTDDLLTSLDLLKELDYVTEHIYKLLRIACEYHDYGKVNDEFQKRVKSKSRLIYDIKNEVAHNVLSLCFVDKNDFERDDDYLKVCYSILNHHHYTNNFNEVDDKEELINDFRKKFCGKRIKPRLIDALRNLKSESEAQLLKGFLHKCDYSASGNFVVEYKNDFLIKSMSNLNYQWNELQNFCSTNTNENIIVVANTGMGKTEAGLLWIGDNKGFFILPLRTAINAIYDRVRYNILKGDIEEKLSLLHSDTLSYYIKEEVSEDDKILEYISRGKNLSMPLTISTLDQLFNFVYKYNGFELKLATLSYSKIVIDEIQAYSPDLLAYLVYGLEKITECGGRFAILTATLPPFVRDYITENIDNTKFAKFTEGKDRHFLKTIEGEIESEFIANHFDKYGGKVLIVCNTVKKSQELFDKLKSNSNIPNIELIHSKYIKRDRKVKEDKILEFGKTEVKGNAIWVATSIVEASLDIDFDYLFTELNDINGLFQRLGRVNRKAQKDEMLDKPNAFVFTDINDNILTNKNGTRGFIDRTLYMLSKEAIFGFNGILSENKKVELIDKYLTTDKIKQSYFNERYKTVKNYIQELYIGEKELKEVQKVFRNISSYAVIPESVYEDENNKKSIEVSLEILKMEFIYDETKSKKENLDTKDKLYLDKIKAKERIYDYTVSVGIYDLNESTTSINIGYEKIIINKCSYSFEKGFEREKKEYNETAENTYDNFM